MEDLRTMLMYYSYNQDFSWLDGDDFISVGLLPLCCIHK